MKIILPLDTEFDPGRLQHQGQKVVLLDDSDTLFREGDVPRVLLLPLGDECNKHPGEAGRLRCIRESDHVGLGIVGFKVLWDCRDRLPESWKRGDGSGPLYITFDGILIETAAGAYCVPCIYFLKGKWHAGLFLLDYVRRNDCRAAVVPKPGMVNVAVKGWRRRGLRLRRLFKSVL